VTAEQHGGDAVNGDCPLKCGRQARDHVDWAGLPINLDMAFSQQQCDKVYRQHLMRKREAQLRRWLPPTTQWCACEASASHRNLDSDAARDYV
jgi:hypothetical protein